MKVKSICYGFAALLFVACGQKSETGQKSPIRVKVAQVSQQVQNAEGTSYVGIVEESEATAVSFTSMGTLRRVYVSEGQSVSQGQLIAEIDDTQARNMLAVAEAQQTQADDALQRYSILHEEGSMTDAQWVEIQSKVAQARSQVAVAKKNLADCRLVAPVSGVVGRKNLSAGETAMPSQAVVTLLNVNSVKVKMSVPEGEMAYIQANTPSTITVDAIHQTFEGGKIEKGVQADAMTHTYDVRVCVQNKDKVLLPGMVATVKLQCAAHGGDETITLPLTCVQRRADGSLFVWTVDASKQAHRTAVKVGPTYGNNIAITAGLSKDARVVTEGYQKLSEGTAVIF